MALSTPPTPARFWPLLLNGLLCLLLLLSYNRSLTVILLFALGGTALNILGAVSLLLLGNWRVAAWFGGLLVALLLVAGLAALLYCLTEGTR